MVGDRAGGPRDAVGSGTGVGRYLRRGVLRRPGRRRRQPRLAVVRQLRRPLLRPRAHVPGALGLVGAPRRCDGAELHRRGLRAQRAVRRDPRPHGHLADGLSLQQHRQRPGALVRAGLQGRRLGDRRAADRGDVQHPVGPDLLPLRRRGGDGAGGAQRARPRDTANPLHRWLLRPAGLQHGQRPRVPVRRTQHLRLDRDRARRREAVGDRPRPAGGTRLARRRPAAALRRQRSRRHPPAAGAGRRAPGPGDQAAVRYQGHGALRAGGRSARPRSGPRCPTGGTRSASRPRTPPATSRASTARSPSTATRPASPSSPRRAAAGSPSTPSTLGPA